MMLNICNQHEVAISSEAFPSSGLSSGYWISFQCKGWRQLLSWGIDQYSLFWDLYIAPLDWDQWFGLRITWSLVDESLKRKSCCALHRATPGNVDVSCCEAQWCFVACFMCGDSHTQRVVQHWRARAPSPKILHDALLRLAVAFHSTTLFGIANVSYVWRQRPSHVTVVSQ